MTFESNPTCPYCGHEVDSDDNDLWEYEGEDNPFECPNCEKELVLNVQVTTEYELKRPECSDDEHEYGEWYRRDIDQDTLDRWAKDSMMKSYVGDGTYTYYTRECKHCDDKDYSPNYPLGQELEQHEVKSRYDKDE
ncbi:hypothetical protein IBZ20DMU1_51 [Acinetobacter phage DMU1]|nr:hypothetical protein IBZ20DMU1_51 [Acinetobacter phage DMU1]